MKRKVTAFVVILIALVGEVWGKDQIAYSVHIDSLVFSTKEKYSDANNDNSKLTIKCDGEGVMKFYKPLYLHVKVTGSSLSKVKGFM